MNEINEILKRLQEAQRESGLSYVQLEKRTGLSKSSIQRYISGTTKKVPFSDLEKICRALGCDPVEVLGWSEDPDDAELYDLREQMRRDPEMRNLFDLARRATPSDLRAAAAVLKALEKNGHD